LEDYKIPAPKDPIKRMEWKRKLGLLAKDRKGWSKDMTKYNNPSIMRMSNKLKNKDTWMKGKTHTKKSKQLNRIHHLGKTHSIKTKRLMSNAHMGHYVTQSTKRKIGKIHKGKKVSINTRKKISISLINRGR